MKREKKRTKEELIEKINGITRFLIIYTSLFYTLILYEQGVNDTGTWGIIATITSITIICYYSLLMSKK